MDEQRFRNTQEIFKYIFFGLSNVQESLAGEVACTRRFDVVEKKKAGRKQILEK